MEKRGGQTRMEKQRSVGAKLQQHGNITEEREKDRAEMFDIS